MSEWKGNSGSMLGAGSSSFVCSVNETLAVKQFKSADDLRNEQTIYTVLGQYPHPRLVNIYSFGADYILMDRMPNGDLARFIETHPEIAQAHKLQWVAQIAECFNLLHTHRISHYDSKLENFLLDEKYNLKICDFASSHYYKAPSRGVAVQPSRYRRPIDDFNELVFNPADDIFAFGSICYEIMIGGPLYPELDDECIERQFILGNFPETKDLCFEQVIRGCWTSVYKSFEEVSAAVREEAGQAGAL